MIRLFLLSLVDNFSNIYSILLAVRIISSWFYELQSSKIIKMICVVTDPYLNLFRRIIPPLGMLDISPILAFFALQVAASILKWLILSSS